MSNAVAQSRFIGDRESQLEDLKCAVAKLLSSQIQIDDSCIAFTR
jgi:hypothetical protein